MFFPHVLFAADHFTMVMVYVTWLVLSIANFISLSG